MSRHNSMIQPLHPMEEHSENAQIKTMKVSCNICLTEVAGKEVLGHLFFGQLKCNNCLHLITKCSEFKNHYPSKIKCCNVNGTHVMTQWKKPLWDSFYYSLLRNFRVSNFCSGGTSSSRKEELSIFMMKQLELMKPLMVLEPWKTVYEDTEFISKIEWFSSSKPRKPIMQPVTKGKLFSSGEFGNNEQGDHDKEKRNPSHTSKENPIETSKSIFIDLETKQNKKSSNQHYFESTSSKKTIKPKFTTEINFISESSLLNLQPASPTNPPNQELNSRGPQAEQRDETNLKRKNHDHTYKVPVTASSSFQDKVSQQSKIKDSSEASTNPEINLVDFTEKNTNVSPTKRIVLQNNNNGMEYYERIGIIPESVLISNHYQVVLYPQQLCPEQCPNCSFSFTPEMCTVNFSTFIVDLRCPACKLSVYIVPEKFLTSAK